MKLWDGTNHQQIATLSGQANALLNITYSRDGTFLAAGSRDGTVLIWDVSSARTLATLRAHQGAVWALAFSPDGDTLATVGEDRLGKLWDLRGLIHAKP